MIAINFDSKAYYVEPKFEIIREIEEELGSTSDLLARFAKDQWKVSELVTVMHIVLNYAGKTIDYVELGNSMIREGLGNYLLFVNRFLKSII